MFKMLVTSLAVSILFFGGVSQAEILKVAVHEFCPYLCDASKEDGKNGYVVEVLNAIFAPAGYELEFHRVPYVRGIRMTEQGHYDGMPMLNSHSSQEILLSDELIGTLVQNFYVKKGNPWRYQGTLSLENIVVGSILGYNYTMVDPDYEAYLRRYQHTDRVDYVAGVDPSLINIRKILAGRTTTFNECADLVDYLSLKEGLVGQLEIAGTLGQGANYMGFSPTRTDAAKLLEIFDRGIVELRASGRLREILSDYGLSDWK